MRKTLQTYSNKCSSIGKSKGISILIKKKFYCFETMCFIAIWYVLGKLSCISKNVFNLLIQRVIFGYVPVFIPFINKVLFYK